MPPRVQMRFDQCLTTASAAVSSAVNGSSSTHSGRAADKAEPRERDAAALSLRQRFARQMPAYRDAQGFKRGVDCCRVGGQPAGPADEAQIFDRGELVFDAAQMAEVGKLRPVFVAERMDVRAAPGYRAGGGRQQPAQVAQKTGLAAAIGAAHFQERMRGRREAEIAKQPAFAAHAFELGYRKHFASPVRGPGRSWISAR